MIVVCAVAVCAVSAEGDHQKPGEYDVLNLLRPFKAIFIENNTALASHTSYCLP